MAERMFGTLQNRLPQELRLKGITDMEAANRFLAAEYLPAHNARFAITPSGEGSAFVPFAGDAGEILCIHEERVASEGQYGALQETTAYRYPLTAPKTKLQASLCEGQGQGACLSRRADGRVPRPPEPGPLYSQRKGDKAPGQTGCVNRFGQPNHTCHPCSPTAPRTDRYGEQKRTISMVPIPDNYKCSRQHSFLIVMT